MPEQWERIPQRVWIAKLTAENAAAVALWCGGKVVSDAKSSDPTDVAVWVYVPTIDGIRQAFASTDWVMKDDATGRFSVFKRSYIEANFRRVGVRAATAEDTEMAMTIPLGWCEHPEMDAMTKADMEQEERDHIFDMPDE